ncbi:MAG TPA: hypothetical protein VJ302_14080 [Blastocatellia bacterium]|nr:hypothetical protein [Blastocatellia bacterium]
MAYLKVMEPTGEAVCGAPLQLFERIQQWLDGFFAPAGGARTAQPPNGTGPNLPRVPALTFRHEGEDRGLLQELRQRRFSSPLLEAQWQAVQALKSDAPYFYKYERCAAFLKEYWNRPEDVQNFLRILGLRGTIDLMLELSLGPLGDSGGARYLGLALLALNGVGRLNARDLKNLLPPLSRALALPVVSNTARANLLLAFSLGFGDRAEFMVQLAAALGEDLYRQAIADSLRQGSDDEARGLPEADRLPDAVRFGGEHRIFARMHTNIVRYYREQAVMVL